MTGYFIRLATAGALSSALIIAAAVPAAANTASAAEVPAAAAKKDASEEKICKLESQPGSRMRKKVCRTQAERDLEQTGVDQMPIEQDQRF